MTISISQEYKNISSYSKVFIEHCIKWQLSNWRYGKHNQQDKYVDFLIERAELALREIKRLS